jgi:hypothetical protein
VPDPLTRKGSQLFFNSARAIACTDGFVPTFRDLPKQKDKKNTTSRLKGMLLPRHKLSHGIASPRKEVLLTLFMARKSKALNEIFLHTEFHTINWNTITTSRRKVVLIRESSNNWCAGPCRHGGGEPVN